MGIKIAHLADIHIRPVTRHDEYKQVTIDAVTKMKAAGVEVVFVAGDIFHTKTTGISPEYIEFLPWFLRELSSVGKVIMMLGNHDGNLANLSRQDAISPIVKLLDSPNIILCKDSEQVTHKNITFSIFSPFDKENWDKLKPVKGSVNIACFHGTVGSSKTDTGWELDGEVELDFFNDYDFGFLGDVHKGQALAWREVEIEDEQVSNWDIFVNTENVKRPTIAYPGSFVQQSHGESKNKGFLLWDISDRNDFDVKFVDLVNPKPFITIDYSNDETFERDLKNINSGARVRVSSSQKIDFATTQRITAKLKNNKLADEITFKIDDDVKIEEASVKDVKFSKNDLRDVDVHMQLLRKYAESKKLKFTDEEYEDIRKKYDVYLKKVVSLEDVRRNVKWTIQKMSFDNSYVFGEDNVIDFSKLNGLVGLFGKNRIGKSSVIGTIAYGLFNASDRGSVKNQFIVNERKQHCVVKTKISVADVGYEVERQTVKHEQKKNKREYSITNVNMKQDGEEEIDLNGEQRRDTDVDLRKMIGTFDDFSITALSTQFDTNAFIDEGSTKRRSLLSKFLDLDIFESINKLVKVSLSDAVKSTDGIDAKTFELKLDEYTKLIVEQENKLETFKLLKRKLELDKSELLKQIGAIGASDVDVDSLKREKDNINERLLLLNKKIDESNARIAKIDAIFDACQKEIIEIDLSMTKKLLDAADKLKSSRNAIDRSLSFEQQRLSQFEKTASKLKEVPCGDKFPTCKFIKDAHESKGMIEQQKIVVDDLQKQLLELDKELLSFDIDTLKQSIERHADLTQKCKTCEIEKVKSTSLINENNNTKEMLNEKLEKLIKKLSDVSDTSLFQQKKKLQSCLDEKDDEISTVTNNVDSINKLITSTQVRIEDISEKQKKFDEAIKNAKKLEFMFDATSKNGLPLLVIESQLPTINAELAKLLSGVTNFSVMLELDDTTLDVFISYGDSKRLIEMCSGMEKIMTSIALRVILTKITTLPKPDFLIIDEGFGSFDDVEITTCVKLLQAIREYYRFVMIITHVNSLKESADMVIEVGRQGTDSYVRYQ